MILSISFIPIFKLSSRKLILNDFRVVPLDISAREKAVYDPNGDGCAIIKVRIGITDVKFNSDLEIRKTEWQNGEYWLWVSPGTKKIYVEAPDFPEIEYEFTHIAEALTVYVLNISAELPEHAEIRYKTINSLSFKTIPEKADIYINDLYFGKSPLALSVPFDTFEYKITKKTFLPEIHSDSIQNNNLEYMIRLEKDPYARRFFTMASVGFSSTKWDGIIYGINLGYSGRTGIYGSYYFSREYNSSKGFSDVPEDSEPPENARTFSNRSRLCLGLTVQEYSFLFLNFGLGLASSQYYYEIEDKIYRLSWPYYPESSPDTPEYKGNFNNFIFNPGFSLRFNNRLLVNISSILSINIFKADSLSKVTLTEWYAGIGYHF